MAADLKKIRNFQADWFRKDRYSFTSLYELNMFQLVRSRAEFAQHCLCLVSSTVENCRDVKAVPSYMRHWSSESQNRKGASMLFIISELVQGWCNNVAWNVGPLTWLQYKVAINRHDFYKLHHFRSIIPMIQLSWNLARNCHAMRDQQLVSLLHEFLGRSLSACTASLQCAAKFGKEVKWHGRVDGEPAHYCESCEVRWQFCLFCTCFIEACINVASPCTGCWHYTRDQKVAGLILAILVSFNDPGQVVHTYTLLLTCSIIWYWTKVMWLERWDNWRSCIVQSMCHRLSSMIAIFYSTVLSRPKEWRWVPQLLSARSITPLTACLLHSWSRNIQTW